MMELAVKAELIERDGQHWVTSLDVSKDFGKDHGKVLKKIEGLDCSEEFNQANFSLVEYRDAKGENRPMYYMTRDGFMLLVMEAGTHFNLMEMSFDIPIPEYRRLWAVTGGLTG